jgi:hypothetical protein
VKYENELHSAVRLNALPTYFNRRYTAIFQFFFLAATLTVILLAVLINELNVAERKDRSTSTVSDYSEEEI